MSTTRKTLLQRVRDPANREAWTEFFDLYAPLLEAYALAQGLSRADAEEVRDRCLEVVARRLPSFEYQRSRGRFQGWLHAIARGKIVDLRREQRLRRGDDSGLATVEDPEGGPDAAWDRAWRREHLLHGLRQVRASEPAAAFRVFELLLIEELSVPEVCARTGLNANQVYKAKARVLARVREHLARLGVDGPLT